FLPEAVLQQPPHVLPSDRLGPPPQPAVRGDLGMLGLARGVQVEGPEGLGGGVLLLEGALFVAESADRGALDAGRIHADQLEAALEVLDLVLGLVPVLPDPVPDGGVLGLGLHLVQDGEELLLGVVGVAEARTEGVRQGVDGHGYLRGWWGDGPGDDATCVPGVRRGWAARNASCTLRQGSGIGRAEGARGRYGVAHVVFVGLGFGGLYALRKFLDDRPEGVRVTAIDRRDRFVFTPLLYEYLAGELDPDVVAPRLETLVPEGEAEV